MADLNVVDVIVAKRDGGELPPDTMRDLIAAYTRGGVPDYQMSAFLMAGFLRGLSGVETFAMTEAMLDSGLRIDLAAIPGKKVGKHSTGGVGDKVSLVLAPIVAACGIRVPKVSGRGLGFTGGTLDKLEAVPGLKTTISTDEYRRQIAEIGLVIAGQTEEIAPADKALYALRDVTGTVDFIPFIASSIMSKKLAEGIDALVLDVKCGRGAFMQDEDGARRLAETLVEIGERMGTRTVAWMTRMDVPLGRAVGNWPEVVEAVHCLQGADVPDLMDVVQTLAAEMIVLGERAETVDEGREWAQQAVKSGRAFDVFRRLVERQGGDPTSLHDPEHRPGYEPAGTVRAPRNGIVSSIDALAVGRAAATLGAGRQRKEDAVDPLAGIVLSKKPGDAVARGETLAHLYTRRAAVLEDCRAAVGSAFAIQDDEMRAPSTIRIGRYADATWQPTV